MGFAVEGRGNLSGGFAGKLAASAPGLTFGACNLDRFRALVDIGVTARRPKVKGPIGAESLRCPASNLLLAQPRMEINSSFAEGFDRFDGGGRLTMASFQGRRQRNGRRRQQPDLPRHAGPRTGPDRPCGAAGAA